MGILLEFVEDVNDYGSKVLDFGTGKLHREVPEIVKLAETMKIPYVRSFLHNAPYSSSSILNMVILRQKRLALEFQEQSATFAKSSNTLN